jgi:hypothetical protein
MKGWRVVKDGIQLDKSNLLYYMLHGIKCTCGQLPSYSQSLHGWGTCGGLWSRLVSGDIVCTCTFCVYRSTGTHSKQQFLTSNISYSLLLYHLTGILNKTMWHLPVEWYRHTKNIFVFPFLPPWRRQHECPKNVGGHYLIKLHSYIQAYLFAFSINFMQPWTYLGNIKKVLFEKKNSSFS